jgi:hypothetical protein
MPGVLPGVLPRKSILPGIKMQWRSGSCSADVPGHDMVAARTWLQCGALRRVSRCSGAAAAAAPMSPGVMWRQRTHGCRGVKTQQPDVPGHDMAVVHTWLQRWDFPRSQDAVVQWWLQRQCPQV